ncbi:siderophore-interacting protein [Stakelama tenebrarum]|uniref:Siderophore-interacting protein n=1 Tax=Stakelama tenebrarum TaxID=2711215 RepID=A0A6G6Y479_9SPHN|nr:siderophore-interacting protein [Sphingosinithalassobacter tenebrarum]QIG79376.1 siderophore-interacting protein [Sphingosinithalassobacter tenebrarum]
MGKALIGLMMKRAIVTACEDPGGGFRLVTLEGAALRRVAWTAGQKAQIAMGSAFVARTYTPIEWNVEAGRTRILGYAHGDGPGSDWLLSLAPGDECDLFGPRASLNVSGVAGPLSVFGDETSMGLAYALIHQHAEWPVECQFEANDITACEQVVTRLGLSTATLVARRRDDAHLRDMAKAFGKLPIAPKPSVWCRHRLHIRCR